LELNIFIINESIQEYMMNIDKIIREEITQLNETAGKNMPDSFFDQVVRKLGGTPTEEKRRFFQAWKRAEGTSAKFNPLATTLKLKTSHGGSSDFKDSWNKGQPVQDYKTMDAGVDATFWTLKNTKGGKAYQNLVDKLKSDDVTAEELAAEKEELGTWSDTAGTYVAKQLGSVQVSTKNNDSEEEAIEPISPNKDSDDELIDKIQTVLDFAGFVPFIGDAIDIINGIIYLIRGRYWDALLSAIAIIPGVGSVIAVPLRVATKATKKVLGSAAIETLVKGGPLFQNWLVKLIKSGKVDANILEQLSKKGDDVAKMIQDASKKVENIPGGEKISKYTDEYVDLLKGRLDDIGEAVKQVKTGTKIVSLATGTGAIKWALKRSLSGKLVRGFTDPAALNGMRKGLQNKFVTQLSKDPNIIKKMIGNLNAKQTDSLAEFLKVTPAQVQNLMKGVNKLNPKSTERLLKHMTDNKKIFGKVNDKLNRYKTAYVEQGLAQIKNLSFKRGAGKLLFNTSDRFWSNFNFPKLVSKSLYIGQALMSGDNSEVAAAGEDIKQLGEEQAKLYATINLSEPDDEQAKKEIMNQQDVVVQAQQKAERSIEKLDSIEYDNLSENDKELLKLLIEQYSE